MRPLSFVGGIHPDYQKGLTSGQSIQPFDAPEEIVIPLSQHIGAPAKALVAAGDDVLRGQKIADAGGFVSAPVHSSVSGKVIGIESRLGPMGKPVPSIVIQNDGEDRMAELSGLGAKWESADTAELKNKITEAGIVGMGGATFPTVVKLSPPANKPIDTVIINGAECEPYLTADHRVMVEAPEKVVSGLRIVMKVLGASKGIIGIEVNKPDAIKAMQEAVSAGKEAVSGTPIEVASLEVKYPQGAEKQLIDACLKRQVPSGGLPMDVGVVVQNSGTVAAIHDAICDGIPLMERVVTITGSAITTPCNMLVRVGTSVEKVVEACGGFKGDPGKLILGGPMMGFAQYTTEIPVTKGTSGILCLSQSEVNSDPHGPCIKCGRCVRVCPMQLVPTEIAAYSDNNMMEEAESADALDCIECGSCAFDCPARLPLVQQIRLAKAAIMAAKRAKK